MEDYEKLGLFYLGRQYDLATRQAQPGLVLYDSKDLVTHAVCVGMTGSGKTGLCLALMEEAAIDGVPAILIDPKGDLPNLMLTFPQLRPEDFAPWVNPDDARKAGLSPEDFAARQAEVWRKGLADWGQAGERIQRLRDAADVVVYTPGSSAGLPISILKSFAAPDAALLDDHELFAERISTTVTSLLGLLGIEADPIQGREHILLATLLDLAWRQGQDVDLASLIGQIQKPPIVQIGVLDLESFYPAKERFGLVMALNNLLAAPGFSAWLEGEPLDIGQMLHTPAGKPRMSIFSIAHLSDPERMFFVSLLLNQILGWMRAQSGTTSLRAVLYMDEIFGYFPPVANPPSKAPLLTLLKQARAYGLGVVLATQNPVDLDYKGLSNAGTWFIGRLQTDRDKQRVLDGLEGAASGTGTPFNRQRMEELLAGLDSRVFLMNNTHEDAPEVFQTRWVMSYLRGPLTRVQIKTLMDPIKAGRPVPASTTPAPMGQVAPAATTIAASGLSVGAVPAPAAFLPAEPAGRPAVPPEVSQFFIPTRGAMPAGSTLLYRPVIMGAARINFTDTKTRVDVTTDVVGLTPITDDAIPVLWDNAVEAKLAANDLEKTPRELASFAPLAPVAAQAKNYLRWNKDFITWLYGGQKLDLLVSPRLKLVSNPGETERDFRIRLQQSARETRDAAVEKLRHKYAPKVVALQERIRVAQQTVDREAAQAKQSQVQTAISFGTTLLGAFVGRKAISTSTLGRATTAVRGVGRSAKEQEDISRAKDTVAALQQRLAALEADIKVDTEAISAATDPSTEPLDTLTIKPKRTNIAVQLVALAWAPHWQDAQRVLTPAWE